VLPLRDHFGFEVCTEADMSVTTARSIAEAIRQIRTETGETQEKFAKRLGVSVFTIAKYETGVHQPKASIVTKLALQAQSAGLPDLAVLFEKAFREKREKADRVRALRARGLTHRFFALKRSAEQLTKESEKLLKSLKLCNGKTLDDPDFFRILKSANLTLDAQIKSIENLKIIVDRYKLDSQNTSE
jgi:transcriptional regulator with XRE-family HTH domain